MVTIFVDDKEYNVAEGKNLLDVCLQQGLDLPYFCWHPAMGSVGSCRQCAVRQYNDENDTRGRIVMSCMTPVTEGMRVSLEEPKVKEFRDNSIEVLMANHPHDCPVCEEGGECHLQDMTLMSDHTVRRYPAKKNTFENQDLGPCINHEMNRCITCYRCVRFYGDYAGGKDLAPMSSRNQVYFGRQEDGTLESPFSGNLVEVCPTGVFTDKTFARSFNRKWDIQSAPSICTHCSLGCNTSPGERHGNIKRVANRYHGDINGYFICDRGRFGYDYINNSERLTTAYIQSQQSKNKSISTSYEQAMVEIETRLQKAPKETIIGIGSDSASLEENYALQKLVGTENFYSCLNAVETDVIQTITSTYSSDNIHAPSLKEIERADALLVLGEDLLNSAPMMALSVRQATRNRSYDMAKENRIPLWQDASVRILAQQERSPFIMLNTVPTELDNIACDTFYDTPEQIAQMGFAIAHSIDNSFGQSFDQSIGIEQENAERNQKAQEIAELLTSAGNPVVISGSSLNSVAVIEASVAIAQALQKRLSLNKAQLSFVLKQANSFGLAMLTNAMPNQHLNAAMDRVSQQANSGKTITAIVLNTDIYQHESKNATDAFFNNLSNAFVIEHQVTATTEKATVIIPASTVVETEGTYVNNEGRAQRFFEVYKNDNPDLRDNWKTLCRLDRTVNGNDAEIEQCENFDELVAKLASHSDLFSPCIQVAPNADFKVSGMKVPRQTHRATGRTSVKANENIVEQKQPVDLDSALAFSMEGATMNVPPALATNSWAPGWNSSESIHRFQDEINGDLKGGNPGICLPLHLLNSFSSNSTSASTSSASLVPTTSSDSLVAVTQPRIFDGELYSAQSPALTERAESPTIKMHSILAAEHNFNNGDLVNVTLENQTAALLVNINDALAKNMVSVSNDCKTNSQLPLSKFPALVSLSLNQARISIEAVAMNEPTADSLTSSASGETHE